LSIPRRFPHTSTGANTGNLNHRRYSFSRIVKYKFSYTDSSVKYESAPRRG
jgi:hypothetical protein